MDAERRDRGVVKDLRYPALVYRFSSPVGTFHARTDVYIDIFLSTFIEI